MGRRKKTVFSQVQLASGVPQNQFATYFGVAPEVMNRWAAGTQSPCLKLRQIKQLAYTLAMLGLTFADLPDEWDQEIPKLSKAKNQNSKK